MLKRLSLAALALWLATPALAQTTILAERPLKQIKDFDQVPILQGLTALGQGGECSVQYIIAKTGRAKNIIADCSVPEMGSYAIRAVEAAEWEAEVVAGKAFDSYAKRQTFRYGNFTPVDPRGEKAPVLIEGVDARNLDAAIAKAGGNALRCDVTFTVALDGRPKSIATNCNPKALDPFIAEAVGKMRYSPAQKAGQPTDWPGISMPMLFTVVG
jgi:hypothetical protein